MTTLYPILTCGSIGVLGDMQFEQNFLASGASGTAYLNQVATLDYVDQLLKNSKKPLSLQPSVEGGKPVQKVGNFKEAETRSARFYKVESTVPLSEFKDSNNEIKVDFLGFSVVRGARFGLPGKFLPILDSDRLFKALAFLKKDSLSEAEDKITLAINFFRYRVFYVLGGWYHAGLSQILLNRCGAIKKQLGEMVGEADLHVGMEEVLNSLGIKDVGYGDELLEFGAVATVPAMLDVIVFLAGERNRKAFVDWSFDPSREFPPWAYMDYAVFLIEADKRSYTRRPDSIIYGDDVLGQIQDTHMDPKFYEEITRAQEYAAKVPDWGVIDEVEERLRVKNNKPSEKFLEPLPKSSAGQSTTTYTPPTMPGRFSHLPRKTRQELIEVLVPVIIRVFKNHPIQFDAPNDPVKLPAYLGTVASFLCLPVKILYAAVIKDPTIIKEGPPQIISHELRAKLHDNVSYRSMVDELKPIARPGETIVP
jgi:hypothetical protein